MSPEKRMALVSAIRGMAPQAQPLAAPTPPPQVAPPPPVPPSGVPQPGLQAAQTAPLNPPPLDPGMQLPPGQPGSSIGGDIENPAAMQGANNPMQHVGGEQMNPEGGAINLGQTPPLNVSMPPPGGQGGMEASGEDQIGQYIAQQQMEQLMLQRSRAQQDAIVEEMMRRRQNGSAT